MKFCRFRLRSHLPPGPEAFGRIEGDELIALDEAPWEGGRESPQRWPLEAVELLMPSLASKVVLIGQNYRKHAEELGKTISAEPIIFIKPSTSLNGPGQPIVLPPASQEVHHEAELAAVIGRKLSYASEDEARAAIFGLTCFNDVTARDIQRREVQHTRGKGFDTFACVGPWIVTGLSPDDLRVQCRVNGAVKQDGRTSDMVHSTARLIAFISRGMTLLPGDIVSTGTPSGVGPIAAGDRVEIEIEGIGTLVNPVVSRR